MLSGRLLEIILAIKSGMNLEGLDTGAEAYVIALAFIRCRVLVVVGWARI